MKSRHDGTIRTKIDAFARASRALAFGVLCAPLAACSGRVSIGTASAPLTEGGSSSNSCPTPTCSFLGTWANNSGFTGLKCGEGGTPAIRFDDDGKWRRLVHGGSVDGGDGGDSWMEMGAYTVCGDRATGPELSTYFDASGFPGCGPAFDVTIGWKDNVIDAGSACLIQATTPCSPGSIYYPGMVDYTYFPCEP